eukprot:CAMPEP_0197494448 /NCGR_PEP_ID=MMETSP1311-20131121/30056_1 /TAXON_ID=464262 /ORGANISM="Genus nov. species nov., Strain RCC856" /LENGTH=93 /DNA_ID=CAMNT_0043039843 /DNA_START=106 /DNA_END=384 /DNA_ORIENTATION=+
MQYQLRGTTTTGRGLRGQGRLPCRVTAGPRSKSSSRGLRRGFVEAPRAKAEGVELKEYTASDLLNGDGKGDGGDKPAEERSEPKMSVNVDIAK